MPLWNVEVIEPARYARLTSVERLRFHAKSKAVQDAGWQSQRWRGLSRMAETDKRQSECLTKSYEWEDRFSERRAALIQYVAELDAKYADDNSIP